MRRVEFAIPKDQIHRQGASARVPLSVAGKRPFCSVLSNFTPALFAFLEKKLYICIGFLWIVYMHRISMD